MNKVKIITDACSDIPQAWRDEYGIACVPLPVVWDGVEKTVDCDWHGYTPKEFYAALADGAKIRAKIVRETAFERLFTQYIDEGYDVVYIGCSTALSGAFSVGTAVAKRLTEERPKACIYCVNSRTSCGGQAITAVEAAKLAAQGIDAQAIAERVVDIGRAAVCVGSIGRLEYLKSIGRVKSATAFFGDLFGVNPIIATDENGAIKVVKKVKGRQQAIDRCVEMFKAEIDGSGRKYPMSEQTLYVAHADCKDVAECVAERLGAELKPKQVYVNHIGPCIGASVGPTAFAIYGLSENKSLIR